MSMNQRYHVVFKNGEVTVRRPWRKGEELYSSAGAVKDGVIIPAMFGEHEKRQFLELLGQPFIMVTIDMSEKGVLVLRQIMGDGHKPGEGLIVIDPDTGEKSQWQIANYYVRDEGSILVMVPGKQTDRLYDQAFFEKLGLRLDLGPDNWGNTFKVGKYMKRLYSHHRKFGQGDVIAVHGDVIEVRLTNGAVITVRYADYGSLTDGMNFASPRFMKISGLAGTPGLGYRWTSLSPIHYDKGYSIVKPGLQYDLVLYNPKTLLKGDKFTFGLDRVHSGGAVFTDIQSYINFRLNDLRLLENQSVMFMLEVDAALKSEEKLREMLRFYRVGFHVTEDADGDERFIEKDKDWAIVRALRAGVKHTEHPALLRQMFNLFTKTIMNCETNLRAPIQPVIGGARYAMIDPSIFDMWGDPTLEGELHGNEVYCGGKIGEIAFHRQPNAHRGECHIARTVNSQFLAGMDTGTFLFLSRDIGAEAMLKLGGGDYDDRLVYYTDQDVVNHFKKLELDPYPLVKPEVKPEPVRRVNFFQSLKLRPVPVYDRSRHLEMVDQKKKERVSIGYVVNALMLDTVITDHKKELLDYAINHLPKEEKVNNAITWMEQYPGNVLRGVAGQLEIVIDAIKKEGSDLKAIGDEVRNFNNSFAVVPRFFTSGGRYGGRVPASRREGNHPVISLCSIDEELLDIHNKRLDLEDVVTDNSWQMLRPIAEEILTYPTVDPFSRQLALAMRQDYFYQRSEFERKIPRGGGEAEAKAVIESYKKIDESLVTKFGGNPLIIDAMAHLYVMIYDNRRPEAPRRADGTAKPFPDGMLWGPRMSLLTIKMLEKVGLAGRFTPVDFDPEARKYKRQVVKVDVEGGIVKKQGTHEVLGHVDPMADGKDRLLERGFIRISAQEAYPYVPEPKRIVLTVVGGWEAQERSERRMAKEAGIPLNDVLLDFNRRLTEWRAQENKEVELLPYIYVNEAGQEEHAVRVMLDGTEYGHLTREDNVYVTTPQTGWLVRGDTPMTMRVIVQDFRRPVQPE